MKKFVILLICMFPLLCVNAETENKVLECLLTTYDEPFKIEDGNFACSNVNGDKLTFYQNDKDLENYFTYTIDNGIATINVSDTLKFDSVLQSGLVKVSDGKNIFSIYIKNNAYVKPTTTTTIVIADEITYTVVLDNKGQKEEKKCNVKNNGDTCNITLPNLDVEGFTGWGTSNTCKNGNIGNIKVNKNETYYACYEIKNTEQIKEVYLKSLKIFDSNDKEVKFGTFSIKKYEYEFKVLNDVDSLKINAVADENIKIEYIGNENLIVGDNIVTIKLTDLSNITNEYKLKVTRLKEGETISNVNYLSALVIGNYDIDFNKSVFNYDLTIDKDIDKLVINALPVDEENTVDIKNNKDLVNGSVININVSDGEGNVTTYNINIIKESSNILLYVAIGTILLLIVVLIILIILKKKSKPKSTKIVTKKNNNESVEVLDI